MSYGPDTTSNPTTQRSIGGGGVGATTPKSIAMLLEVQTKILQEVHASIRILEEKSQPILHQSGPETNRGVAESDRKDEPYTVINHIISNNNTIGDLLSRIHHFTNRLAL